MSKRGWWFTHFFAQLCTGLFGVASILVAFEFVGGDVFKEVVPEWVLAMAPIGFILSIVLLWFSQWKGRNANNIRMTNKGSINESDW